MNRDMAYGLGGLTAYNRPGLWSAPCEFCHAPPGQPCVSVLQNWTLRRPGGATKYLHAARLVALADLADNQV